MEANDNSKRSLPRYSINRHRHCFTITEVYAHDRLAYYFFLCMN